MSRQPALDLRAKKDPPKPVVKAHEDPSVNTYLRQRARLEPTTGATLYYLRWDTRGFPQGHFVRRWDGAEWGPEFVLSPAQMRGTNPCAMPDGAEAPL